MMSTAVTHVVILVLTVVMVTTVDSVAPSDGEQLTEFKIKQLEQGLENVLKQNAELKMEIEKQKVEMEKQKVEMEKQNFVMKHLMESIRNQAPGGAVYIRWGRTVCEGDAVVVYRGFAGGSWYDNTGGSSNTLCLSESPEWGTYFEGAESSSYIYGVEYELDNSTGSPFSTRNNGGAPLMNQDAPCVLCHTATRQTQVMIPGKKSCPAGWVLEYWGYLVGGSVNHASQEYLCVDEAPETTLGGVVNLDGARWYPVQAYCGSLPCFHYVSNREVTCVVCSTNVTV